MAVQIIKITHDDARIFEGIKNWNKSCEDELFEKYIDKLLVYGNSNCNNHEKKQDLAQEKVQETFIITFEKIRKGSLISNHDGHVLNWMKRTFRNLLSNWRKERKKIHPGFDDVEVPIPEFLKRKIEKTPDDEIRDEEQEKEAEKILYNKIRDEELEKLDKKCQEIIIAFYYEGMSMRDLANNFTYISSERNARQYRYRCIEKLKKKAIKRLEGYYYKS